MILLVSCLSGCVPLLKVKYNHNSPELNKWRIPAESKEDDLLLVKRITNQAKCLIAYFDNAIENDYVSLGFEEHPSPFYFAVNGVAIRVKERVPRKWVRLFCDEEDAWRAYEIIHYNFNKAHWKKNGSAFKAHKEFLIEFNKNLKIPAKPGDPSSFLINPEKELSRNEIIDRLISEVKFVRNEILKVIENKRSILEPVEEYSALRAGIGQIVIPEYSDISEQWRNSFYNEEQARDALDLFRRALNSLLEFKYAGTEFESMHYNLERLEKALIELRE